MTSDASVKITFRIPGVWAHPSELLRGLPPDYRLTPEALRLPDGGEIEFIPMPPDDQFAEIFRSSCRRPATPEELAKVNSYRVNVGLTGPGGSLDAALRMMQAAAAIVRAGGAGVFIDNCALAHGGENWLMMTDDASSDALTFAFAAIIRGDVDVWTMGMHALGFPDIVMRRAEADAHEQAIIEMIRYVAASPKPIGDGHLLADEHGPRFRVAHEPSSPRDADSPLHNPFGRWRLTSMREIAEGN
jgi:hypothetical protein